MDKKERNQKRATDVQRNAYQLTINNPADNGISHKTIKQILVENFPTLRYFCMADEIGKEGTPHTHVYCSFRSRVRFSTIKKNFPTAHIEAARGTAKNNVDYIQKKGRWEKTDKAETRVEGSFEEWGKIPVQKGKRPDLEELYELINDGYSNAEILAINNDYVLNINLLDKVRTTLLIEKYKGTRRVNLNVVYISGVTGMGKTRGILDEHGDANVYRVSDYNHPFDHYSCEPVIAFEEFRSSFRISDMLNYCDIYPISLPARYSNRYACYETAYILSNQTLEEQYPAIQREEPETWKAFLRRIKEVRIYHEDGTVTVYDSVEKYMKRNEEFHSPSFEDDCPFGEQEELNFDTQKKGEESYEQ